MYAHSSKVRHIIAVIVGGALMAFAFGAQAGTKVDVCHGTGSETHPVVQITVNENAVDAHLKHGDTLYDAGEGCGGGGDPDPV